MIRTKIDTMPVKTLEMLEDTLQGLLSQMLSSDTLSELKSIDADSSDINSLRFYIKRVLDTINDRRIS